MAIEWSTRDRRFCDNGNQSQDQLHRVIIQSSEKNTKLILEKLVVMYGQRRILRFVIQSQISRSLSFTEGTGGLGKITCTYS